MNVLDFHVFYTPHHRGTVCECKHEHATSISGSESSI